jgi:3-phytase
MKRGRFASPLRQLRVEQLEERTLLAVNLVPQVETAGASGADDIAIWIHPTDTSQSTVIGAVKTSSTSLRVYNLSGQQIQSVNVSQVNNVDLRYNFPLSGQRVALVVGSNRSNDSISIYRVNPQTRLLENVAARTISTGMAIYGCGMYVSPHSGKYYAFASSESGQVQQWELFDNGAGKVDATRVRSFSVGSRTEGLVADDITGVLYVGEEDVGIWRYSAEPNGGSARTQFDRVGSGGRLTADVEGLSIYYAPGGAGYLIASSQGNNEFAVYRRDGNNSYVGSFKLVAGGGIDGVTDTDGIDVTNFPLGSQFPQGLFVAQDNDENFKLVRWDTIASGLGGLLNSGTTWDPRQVGGQPPTNQPPAVSAGTDQTIFVGGLINLRGAVSDDGLPSTPGAVSVRWEQIGGTGTVAFANANALETTATLPSIGDYVLRLTASDGELSVSDELVVHVSEFIPPPPVVTQTSVFQNSANYSGTRDTMLLSDRATTNRGTATTLGVDGNPDYAALISWDIRSIPSTAEVQSAQIQLQITDRSAHSYPLYAVRRAWEERQATWRIAQQGVNWAAAGAQNSADRDSVPIGTLTAPNSGPATITLNAAGVNLVQSWIANPASNFGIIIQNYSPATDGIDFASREAGSVASRPKLTITYTVPAAGAVAQAVAEQATSSSLTAISNVTATSSPAHGSKSKRPELAVAASTQDAALLSYLACQASRPADTNHDSLDLNSKRVDGDATHHALEELLENSLFGQLTAM